MSSGKMRLHREKPGGEMKVGGGLGQAEDSAEVPVITPVPRDPVSSGARLSQSGMGFCRSLLKECWLLLRTRWLEGKIGKETECGYFSRLFTILGVFKQNQLLFKCI